MLDIGEGHRLTRPPEPEEQAVSLTLQDYPNPFNPETNIRFILPKEKPVILKIYNIRGQLVKTLIEKKLPAGEHVVHWDGRDDANRQIPTGIYFLRMRAGSQVTTQKMALIE